MNNTSIAAQFENMKGTYIEKMFYAAASLSSYFLLPCDLVPLMETK
jgi:hypothetical protein